MILFLDPEGNGLSCVIEINVPNQFMSFRHNTETHLKVELNSPEDYVTMFNDSFPKALQKVKEFSEEKEAYSEAV